MPVKLRWSVLLLCFTLNSYAQSVKDFNKSVSDKKDKNWQQLFNGKDLTGWKQLNGKAKYEVRGNEIVGTTVSNEPNSFLVTEKEYGDFILELELKADTSMNSGIQFRSLSKADLSEWQGPWLPDGS